MPLEIRLLPAGAEAVLARVAPEVFDDPIIPPAAQAFLNDPNHFLAVALDAGVVVGFASGVRYWHPDKARPEFWVNEVGVGPDHRARGLGKALMTALLDAARAAGCAEAWVLTERDNAPALRLYASLGGAEAPAPAVMFTFPLAAGPAPD